MEQRTGYYFGTEINGKWYRRCNRDGLLARGRGKYWFDEKGVFFLRTMTKNPIMISYSDIYDIQTGSWHSGRWGQGHPVVKILWHENGISLSSGFIFTKNKIEVTNIVNLLKSKTCS